MIDRGEYWPCAYASKPGEPLSLPRAFRVLTRMPALARIPGRFIGTGVRPEHVEGAKPLYTS